jgi:hypothetical protein
MTDTAAPERTADRITTLRSLQQPIRASRLPRGERHHFAKITDAQRFAIERDTRRSAIIAKEYGLAPTSVARIRAKARTAAITQLETKEKANA